MPTFAFEALNSAGHEVKDEIEGISHEDVIQKIREQGLFPTKVKERKTRKANDDSGLLELMRDDEETNEEKETRMLYESALSSHRESVAFSWLRAFVAFPFWIICLIGSIILFAGLQVIAWIYPQTNATALFLSRMGYDRKCCHGRKSVAE